MQAKRKLRRHKGQVLKEKYKPTWNTTPIISVRCLAAGVSTLSMHKSTYHPMTMDRIISQTNTGSP